MSELLNFYIERWDFLSPLLIEHLQISFIAVIFATIVGIATGVLIAQIRKLSGFMLGLVSFLYTIPSISMLGFLIPLTGIGNTSAILALSIYALLPIIRATYTGMIHIDSDILEAAKGMGSNERQILWKIKLPLAMPVILSGFKNMVVMTIALAGIASFIGAGGLGVAIYRGITTNNLTMTLAGSISVAILALLADGFITLAERYFTNRRRSHKQKRMIALLVVCTSLIFSTTLFQPNTQKDTIHIATKPMSEEFIIGEMLRILIEDRTNLQVVITKGVGGGTSNIHPAMLKGDFDMYPEYTGTSWSIVLKETTIPEHATLYQELQKKYKEKYQLEWSGLYGFNNTYGIAVSKKTAQRYQLKTYADLAAVSSKLSFGAEYDYYERADGYDVMAKDNQFHFKKTIDLDIGLKYDALLKDEVDVILTFTTDGRVSDPNIVLLQDEKNYFAKYYAGTITREETLTKHPELRSVLELLTNQITQQEMAEMNYQVEEKGMNETDVAKAFLQKKHLLEGIS